MNEASELILKAVAREAAADLGPSGGEIWRELFLRSPIALSLVDENGAHVSANHAFADLVGCPLGDLVGLTVADLTRPEDLDWTKGYMARLIKGELDTFSTDKVWVRRDGTNLTVTGRLQALRRPDGTCSGVIGAFHEADVRGQVEDQRLRRLLSHSDATVTVVDENGAVLETTGRYQAVLGYPPEYWEHRTIFDLLAPGQEMLALAFREEVLSSPGQRRSTELKLRGATGEEHAIRLHALNLLDDESVRGVILTTINITEELQVFEGLHERTATAEAVIKAQTMLLATVSHELRNPLHALQGVAELLTTEALPPRAQALAGELLSQLTGLTDLTQDLLDTAQASAGTVRVRPGRVALHQLLNEVARYGEAMITSAGAQARMICTIDPGVPELVVSDGIRLRQIFRNLVGNAIKFTPTGTVELRASHLGGPTVQFSIADSGTGIPDHEIQRIREPFVTGALAGAAGGAGLGLSIVSRTLTALGGTLDVASTLGTGSTFTVTIDLDPVDLEPASPAPIGEPVANDQDELAGRVVLVVEDNIVNQQLARGQLARLGMEAHIVGSGEDAIALLTSTGRPRFDVVLMDHGLPGMDGVETMKAMRVLGGDVGSLPVICVTASAAATDRQRFLEQGMDGFVSKPASLASLRDGMTALFRERARRQTQTETSPHPKATTPIAEPVALQVAPPVALQVVEPVAGGPVGSIQAPETRSPTVQEVHDTLESLCDDFGDRSLVKELVGTFQRELPNRLDAIIAGETGTSAAKAAHMLKSSARLVGARTLGNLCEEIERGAAAEEQLLRALAALATEALQAWLAESSD